MLLGIADDTLSSICEQFFTSRGFAVESGWCRSKCWELLQTWNPHALILDVDMQPGDGDGLLARLRNDPRHATLPVLAIVRDRSTEIRRPHIAPIVAYFRRPLDLAAMLDALQQELPELSELLVTD